VQVPQNADAKRSRIIFECVRIIKQTHGPVAINCRDGLQERRVKLPSPSNDAERIAKRSRNGQGTEAENPHGCLVAVTLVESGCQGKEGMKWCQALAEK
jgi:hypothetical protein